MENKYPYIGKYNGMIGLLTSKGYGICLSIESSKYGEWVQESKLKNITADYLRNTKIRVVSPEHSEFVQKLVFGVGGKWGCGDCLILKSHKYIFINKNLIIHHTNNDGPFIESQCKEIKLPMPPSRLPKTSIETPMQEVKRPKQGDEWPRVGDDVSWGTENRFIGYVLSRFGDYAWIRSDDSEDDDAPITIDIDKLTKPPTPQERLELNLSKCLGELSHPDFIIPLAKAILAGDIEGLEYKKPQ